ncbi:hypothetical protein [Vibrio aphrogenes]|uniref:hypothetical protein n=1 Tax=Vibrio aphrogenes TaxID=1891186 RepID=UPI000B35BF7D|nr:hypothetical protein [Vibrio aphrogenes]
MELSIEYIKNIKDDRTLNIICWILINKYGLGFRELTSMDQGPFYNFNIQKENLISVLSNKNLNFIHIEKNILNSITNTPHLSELKQRKNIRLCNYVFNKTFNQDKLILTIQSHQYERGLENKPSAIFFNQNYQYRLIASNYDYHYGTEDNNKFVRESIETNINNGLKHIRHFNFNWLNKKNKEQINWCYDYIEKIKDEYNYEKNLELYSLTGELDYYLYSIAFFDSLHESIGTQKSLYSKMRTNWLQKQKRERDKKKGKKQCNFLLDKETRNNLERITEELGMNKSDFITKLINDYI